MLQKCSIIVFFCLLSVVSPAIFVGLMLICMFSALVCNLDIAVERICKIVAQRRSDRPFRIPCNLFVIGLLLISTFALVGFGWRTEALYDSRALEMLRMVLVIGWHFGALMLLVGSMHKFVKLVD